MRLLAAFVFAALLTACASTPDSTQLARELQPRTVWIVGTDGQAVGQATFTEAPTGVLIHLEFLDHRLPPGWHGLHLHTRGDCSDFANGFQASGSHITLNHRIQHGLLNSRGPEAGDLPNIFAAPNGIYGAEVFSPHVTMHSARIGNRLPLLDEDGAALLIHAHADDQTSQPIGNAGARLACAALTPLP
ncbi:MAG: superoxide dismutase family protein [Hyphomonadaceae bacterium]|nr:superoxide dismutase family protein [Hyphomonadaceae bacterium]